MNVSVETREGLERRVVITVPSDEINQKVDLKLREAARGIKLPGFRPGKVPMREVRRRFGDEVTREATGEVVQTTLTQALSEQNLAPAGTPNIEVLSEPSTDEFSYAAEFEVFPEIELADLATLAIERPSGEVTDEDLELMLQNLREQRKAFSEVERASVDGDQLSITFEGRIDGELFDGGAAEEPIPLVLGSGSMIEGFESGLVGASAGESRTLHLSFPDDYSKEDLAGKAVIFETQVISVSESVVPELDAELIKSYGVESGELDDLRTEVRQSMDKELDGALRGKLRQNTVDALLASHPDIALPEPLVQQEVQSAKLRIAERFGISDPQQLPDEIFASQADAMRAEAEKRVQAGLIFNEIRSVFELEVDGDRVREEIEKIASSYEHPQAVVQYYYSDEERLSGVESGILEEQLIDHILTAATVTETSESYGSLVRGESADAGEEAADA